MAAARRITDPSPASRRSGRLALQAGLAFMGLVGDERARFGDLVTWLADHVVGPGLAPSPTSVHEPGIGSVSVEDAASRAVGVGGARDKRAGRIVGTARVRVAMRLSGLLARPPDDRFLAEAIFAGRVQRSGGVWSAAVASDERLSDLVLALFAADVLTHREDYDARLCVCEICGEIALRDGADARTRCAQHPAH
jgi:hypothetical protein